MAVKWRFFNHLAGGADSAAERVYLWHIAKRRASGFVDAEKWTIDVFRPVAKALLSSMYQHGFLPEFAIPIDPRGELLGGAHRTACALWLGIDCYVQRMTQTVWAPAWDRQWFIDNGMSEEDLSRTLSDWKEMCSV